MDFSASKIQIAEQKPRLTIKRIILHNFKSYRGTLEVGPFHEKFSAIVGPNGSGKSNLIDSLLFVFGKRADDMRFKNMTDLIHKSTTEKDIDEAWVEVEFAEVVKGKENLIKIKRTIKMNRSGAYYINGRTVTHKDLVDYLLEKGVDLINNRFLILQGEVEEISQMGPIATQQKPGLTDYLEDVIGTVKYVPLITELEAKQEALNEIRISFGQLVSNLKNKLQQLEGKKDSAMLNILRENRLFRFMNIKHQAVQLKLTLKYNKELEEYDKHKLTRNQLKEELSVAAQHLTDLLNANVEVEMEARTTTQAVRDLQDKIKLAAEYDKKDRADGQQTMVLLEKLQERIQNTVESRNRFIDDRNELISSIPDDSVIQAKQEEFDKINERYQKLHQEFSSKNQELENKKLELQQDAKAPEWDLDNTQDTLNQAKQRLNQLVKPILKDQTGLNREITHNQQVIKDLQDMNKRVAESCVQIEATKQEQLNFLKTGQQQLMQLNHQIEISKKRNQNGNDNPQDHNPKALAIKGLLNWAQVRQIKGIIGRIGDLATIDPIYDIAVSTQGYSGLNNILVEDVEAAEQAIQFLKDQKLQRLTFVLLDKIQNQVQYMEKPVKIPPGAKRIMDILNIPVQRHQVALYKVFGNTMVVDNIEIGDRLFFVEKYNYNYVTLEGQLIGNSGIMSGGAVKRGQMGFTMNKHQYTAAEMQKLVQQRDDLASKIQQTQMTSRNLDMDMTKLRQIIPTNNEKITSHSQLIEELQSQIQDVAEIKRQIESYDDERKKLLEVIQTEEVQFNKLQVVVAAKRKLIAEVQAKLDSVQNGELTKLTAVYEKLKEDLKKLKSDSQKGKSREVLLQKQIDKLNTEEQDRLSDKAVLEQRMNEIQAKYRENEENAKNLANKLEIAWEAQIKAKQAQEEQSQKCKESERECTILKEKVEELKKLIAEAHSKFTQTKKDENDDKIQHEKIRRNYQDLVIYYEFFPRLDELSRFHLKTVQENDEVDLELLKQMKQVMIFKDQLCETDVQVDLEQTQVMQFLPILTELDRLIGYLSDKLSKESKETNRETMVEFIEVYDVYMEKNKILEDAKNQVISNRTEIERLKQLRLTEFMEGFNIINTQLQVVYQQLALQGDAEMEIQNALEPFKYGIELTVRPPRKTWKKVQKLSGGEKTIASLALIFALHHYKPTPLYFLDEIDAALDYRNVALIGQFVQKRSKDAQFIVVTLRPVMVHLADRLIGIYKTNDQTKNACLDMVEAYHANAKAKRSYFTQKMITKDQTQYMFNLGVLKRAFVKYCILKFQKRHQKHLMKEKMLNTTVQHKFEIDQYLDNNEQTIADRLNEIRNNIETVKGLSAEQLTQFEGYEEILQANAQQNQQQEQPQIDDLLNTKAHDAPQVAMDEILAPSQLDNNQPEKPNENDSPKSLRKPSRGRSIDQEEIDNDELDPPVENFDIGQQNFMEEEEDPHQKHTQKDKKKQSKKGPKKLILPKNAQKHK